MDIRCNKTDCKYNNKYACRAKEIHVAKNTDCRTYEKDFKKNKSNLQDVSRDMFEVAPEIGNFSHNDKLCVDCNAECLFNKMGKCNANGITVVEDQKKVFCGTFIEE